MVKEKTIAEQCVEYVHNNFNRFVYDAQYTYSQMCINRCSLHSQNPNLYDHIMELIEDFELDYELEGWFNESGLDVEDVFDMYLLYLDRLYKID